MGADDDGGHLAAAGEQQAELAVELPGEFRELAGQFVGDNPLRRDAPPVELTEALEGGGRQARQVAVDPFDGVTLLETAIKKSPGKVAPRGW
jgi:hypothetical protein